MLLAGNASLMYEIADPQLSRTLAQGPERLDIWSNVVHVKAVAVVPRSCVQAAWRAWSSA